MGTSLLGRLRRSLLGISPDEATFARRGFEPAEPPVRERLELIGKTFLHGYHAALEEADDELLDRKLNTIPVELRGFGFEGAAMALGLTDALAPWRRERFPRFLEGPGAAHAYMMHVGVGWVLGRLPLNLGRCLSRLDPLLCWLAVDGYGFHEGYFHCRQSVEEQRVPRRLASYARRAFDQGLGRSLWFVHGADVRRIRGSLCGFSPSRRPDLWSGVGLASSYAGGVDEPALRSLLSTAGPHQPQLAQGAAFAAKARQRAGNPAVHTDLACRVLCGISADEAARATDEALKDLPPDGLEPRYELWRQRIQQRFAAGVLV